MHDYAGADIGDAICFGSYEQDNNTANGKEEIEWIVLAKEGDRILVISRYALDCQNYNSSIDDVTWENCSLRKWLNGSFLNTAFTENEQVMIPSVTVSAGNNPSYSTGLGNSTTDQVFLLDITEVNKYFSSSIARQCQGTAYCHSQGAYKFSNDNCKWWLRSPGINYRVAAYVNDEGSVNDVGQGAISTNCAVRPAMWIYLGA